MKDTDLNVILKDKNGREYIYERDKTHYLDEPYTDDHPMKTKEVLRRRKVIYDYEMRKNNKK